MKIINLSLVAALVSTLALGAEDISELSVSGSVALTNNYIWRGMTQTDNAPAVQSSLNFLYKGFYLGAAASNVKFEGVDASIELDALGGYTSEVYGVGYDIGAIYYAYPKSSKEANFADVYLGLSKDFEVIKIGAKFYRGVKTNDLLVSNTWETSLSVPLPISISFDALYGDYADVGNYYSVGFAKPINDKFKVAVSYTGINKDANGIDEENVVAVITASF
ncbi:MAG: hypothetical protein A2513_09615 [Sulfurimonas sp. RIFOXYD12_FULL_33_39]|uniref:TorF family putative porin n=1 Tax=Sulfurimonas sp. RIFOXYD12_FULL_33_39 TaxID=1802259 RepID=UPI0008C9CE6E|nr:TorF family putative porin [Sulfurimonas sp. RIFOXYD12_FULL_33_39]OHE08665.1 MAG: hypothetical protein A2513_09615 [Sulfurimonas sp. RIFOXYD12_FULL_33_39]